MLVAGVAALLLAFGIGGTHSVRRLVGTNGVGNEQFVAIVQPQQVLCQTAESVPTGTGYLRMTIGTYGAPGPLLRASVQAGERKLLPLGRLSAGWKQGVVDVPLGVNVPRRLSDVRVCIRSSGRLAIAGAELGRSRAAHIGRRPARGRVRMEFVRGERQSAWDLAGTMASRMTFARGLWGAGAPWLTLTLVLLGAAGAGRALLGTQDHDTEREHR